jgi:DNA-binding NarL/FixJ family response regulator
VPARCLIVDDEAPARAELRYLLTQFDQVQVVGEATNAEEALTLLRSLSYDLVLLDIRMPGLDGTQVLAALRRDSVATRVLFISAFMEAELAYETVAAGRTARRLSSGDTTSLLAGTVRLH